MISHGVALTINMCLDVLSVIWSGRGSGREKSVIKAANSVALTRNLASYRYWSPFRGDALKGGANLVYDRTLYVFGIRLPAFPLQHRMQWRYRWLCFPRGFKNQDEREKEVNCSGVTSLSLSLS